MNLSLMDKAFLLKESTLFSSLDLDLLLNVADKMYSHLFAKDQVILHEGENVHHLYLIARGGAALHDQEKKLSLQVGDYFGDEPLLSEQPVSYSVTCTQGCEVLTLSRRQLFSLIGECPALALSMLREYALRLPLKKVPLGQ